jgi:hypothetical protein
LRTAERAFGHHVLKCCTTGGHVDGYDFSASKLPVDPSSIKRYELFNREGVQNSAEIVEDIGLRHAFAERAGNVVEA